MKKSLLLTMFALLALFALTACGALSAPEEASGPIEAVPLEVEESTDDLAEETSDMEEEMDHSEAEDSEEEATEEEMAEDADSDAEMAEEETMEEEPAESAATGGLVVYSIVPGESTVRFELDEDLRGSRITVVGETDQVAGELAVDFTNLADTQVGTIQINARTLVTDNNFRNRAIQNEILETGANEFITFAPTAVNGLPDSVAAGDTIEFTIDGDLTVAGTTNPATFEITATAVSADQITGTASAVINRNDYNLTIPTVPNVANVEEEVELYIDFVASVQQ